MRVYSLLLTALLAATIFTLECSVSNSSKVDCGYLGINESQCESKGCCWQPTSSLSYYVWQYTGLIFEELSDNVPWCFYGSDSNVCNKFNFVSNEVGFTQQWYNGMYENFMANINVIDNGAVCAAPDTNTPGGSYYYDWMRDAALSMRTYMELNDYDYSTIKHDMEKYLSWVTYVQNEADPNGISILVEPKFVIPTRQPYTGGWCRPQTDGPGLRSGTLIQYANVLLEQGQSVPDNLWTAIEADLNWVNYNWQSNGCDLWEEIQSTDFFWNRMAFYQALTWGSQLATTLGKSSTASTWSATAATIRPTLLAHWNGSFIYESTNREKDSSVIHALVNLNEGVFDISGHETTATINVYSKLFCSEYPINQEADSAGIPGVLYGRYEGDTYAGGNPWQLLTASLAEAFYKGATSTLQSQKDYFLEEEIAHWREIFELPELVRPQDLAAAQKSAGNAVMYRIWNYVKSNTQYSLYEQMDKYTGTQMSAKDLTWSYANVLRVLHYYVFNSSYQAQFEIEL